MEANIPIPKGWNERVQSAILHATSLGWHCFVSIVSRLANSPKAATEPWLRMSVSNTKLSPCERNSGSRTPEWQGSPPSDAPNYSAVERL